MKLTDELLIAAAARIASALALHVPLGGTSTCGECFALCPCPTVVALRGDVPTVREETPNDQH